jgi:hypothetical protein
MRETPFGGLPQKEERLSPPQGEVHSTADWPYKLAIGRKSRIFCRLQGMKQRFFEPYRSRKMKKNKLV